ncbi:epoxide hydrolase [Nocardioides sp. GY 10113]|uniref:limonene-1,2-epoxide hydrolase family protein n=1 Tax=Nocardioides sp. GY 10113 TaxID=2569761 RepID=UPI0010A7DC33|nr:limonene-1,2-epoxide hydrolase family protein [Nocardioides sp. GY 10113]TIC85068.1 epoxide hydrolase [Nocardioides sp. GY 10113]
MSSPEAVVRDLLDSLAANDLEAALDLLDEEVVWKNTYLPTMRGPQVSKALRDMMERGGRFEVTWHHVAATDTGEESGIVLTDRTDLLGLGKWSTSFWVRGTFEVRDGKVVLWDDAFSWAGFIGSSLMGLVRMIVPR